MKESLESIGWRGAPTRSKVLLLPKVFICYVVLKKVFELPYIVTSLFSGEHVGNCEEQRAAHTALCSSGKLLF